MKVLVCGDRSFAATGLVARLQALGHDAEGFSRGSEGSDGSRLTGDVFRMADHPLLKSHYDYVVNFILIKDAGVKENQRFAQSLLALCERVRARELLHVSSISAYDIDTALVTETTPLPASGTPRGPYARLKLEVDHALSTSPHSCLVSFLRPGFILPDVGSPASAAGIVKRLPGGLALLLGDAHTPLPVIRRSELHEAIARIIVAEERAPTYLLFANDGMTKRRYAARHLSLRPLALPRSMVLLSVTVLRRLGLFTPVQAAQVRGLFRRTRFDSTATEKRLGMRFEG